MPKQKFQSVKFSSLIAILVVLVSGCQPQGPTLMEAVLSSHHRILERTETQQQYFRQNIRAGMTKQDVTNLVLRTSQVVEDGFISDGKPTNIGFEVSNNATYEVHEYSYYSKVFVLTFENDKLIRFNEKDGVTVIDNM